MELDARAVRVARRQLGLLTRAQAIGLGYTPAQIRTNLARRRWAQTRRGVYLIGGAMLDSARRRAPRSLEDTRACFARLAHGGHRRLDSIRECLTKRLPGYDPGESDLELHTLHALAAAGLPTPVQQLRMTLGGRRRRIDLAYPREKVAIELLGWTYHGGRDEWDADHARGNELTSIGWRYLAFTSAMSADDIVRWTTDALALAAAA